MNIVMYVSLLGFIIHIVWLCILLFYFEKNTNSNEQHKTFHTNENLILIVPALNEEKVIAETIIRFLNETRNLNKVYLFIVDDNSSDKTVHMVKETINSFNGADDKVFLLRRRANESRKGKGDALNWAYKQLRNSPVFSENSILGIMDADAYITEEGYRSVLGYFEEHPLTDLLQIKVRMIDPSNMLEVLQDIEFCILNHLMQRLRYSLGNVAASGNGQFMRASVINKYSSWGNALLEDFEFSLRILLKGARTSYLGNISVFQEAVPNISSFIKQRARWVQGGLECFVKYAGQICSNTNFSFFIKFEILFFCFLPIFTVIFGIAHILIGVYVLLNLKKFVLVIILLLGLNYTIYTYIALKYIKLSKNKWNCICVYLIPIYCLILCPAVIYGISNGVTGKTTWIKTNHGKREF